jgi:hypothetical protein
MVPLERLDGEHQHIELSHNTQTLGYLLDTPTEFLPMALIDASGPSCESAQSLSKQVLTVPLLSWRVYDRNKRVT